MAIDQKNQGSVLMLGTFGMRPKATMRSRALAIARTLLPRYAFSLVTTPWDNPTDAGMRWSEGDVPVVNTRTVRPALFPLAVREMTREFDALRPDLVHLFKPKGFGDLAARRLARRAPVVVDMDDWEGNGGWNDTGGYGRVQRLLFDWQERTWPRRATIVTVASRELERRATALGATPESVMYVPNGLTRDRFERIARASNDGAAEWRRLSLDGKRVVLLYTRFIEFEPESVVRLMAGIRRETPNAILLVVGASSDGRAEATIQNSARAAGLADAFFFHGWSEPDEIPALLSSAHVAIHPFDDNLVNRSKCSVKLLELMAAGMPVVTNDVGENTHAIQHEVSGLLLPAGDVAGMADAVVDLFGNPSRAENLGNAARERVGSHFLWEHLTPRVEEAYRRAIDANRRASG